MDSSVDSGGVERCEAASRKHKTGITEQRLVLSRHLAGGINCPSNGIGASGDVKDPKGDLGPANGNTGQNER